MGSGTTKRYANTIRNLCAAIICCVVVYYTWQVFDAPEEDFTILLAFNGDYYKQANNLLSSIKHNVPDFIPRIKVCVSDKNGRDFAVSNNLDFFEMSEKTQFGDYYSSAMFKMTERKLECIMQVLQYGDNVLYIDTDIVLLEDPMPYMKTRYDINMQNDQCRKPYSDRNLCTGFMFIRSNEKTIALFENTIKVLQNRNYTICDQNAFNSYLRLAHKIGKFKDLKINRLDECLFPNGCRYFDQVDVNCKRYQAKMVHANHMIGLDYKLQRLAEHGLTFAD